MKEIGKGIKVAFVQNLQKDFHRLTMMLFDIIITIKKWWQYVLLLHMDQKESEQKKGLKIVPFFCLFALLRVAALFVIIFKIILHQKGSDFTLWESMYSRLTTLRKFSPVL